MRLGAFGAALLLLSFGAVLGCEKEDPDGDADSDVDSDTDGDSDTDVDTDVDTDADTDVDGDGDGDGDGGGDADADEDEDAPPPCEPDPTDYVPGGTDDWDTCISDDGTYHLVDTTPSTIARVAAFEEMAAILFGERSDLTATTFTDARLVYNRDQGLGSRVERREDEHYPPATDEAGDPAACNAAGIAERPENFDRCVGPAQILPVLNAAFLAGQEGDDLELNAARIEGALLWFLYTSVYKESTTCAATPRDCDSSWAYYGGGEERTSGLGYARYTRAAHMPAHDLTYDGLLAVRCWRDLADRSAVTDPDAWHDRALGQLDRGLDSALAAIVSARTLEVEAAAAPFDQAHWEVVRILGNALGRAAAARDAALAADLAAELESDAPADADLPAIRDLLEDLFPCP